MKNPELEALIRVGALDARILKLRRDAAEMPQSLARQKDKVKALAGKVQANLDEQKRLTRESDKLDLDMKSNLAEIRKWQVQQNTAKSNEAYQALQREIEEVKKKNAALEDQALAGLERVDDLKREIVALKADLAAEEARLEQDEAEVAKEIAALEAEAARFQAERDQAAKSATPGNMELVKRILAKTGDRALAPVHGRTCQGCFMEVPSNSINLLLQGKELVPCRNCARILYLEEDYRATTSLSYAVNDRGESTSKDGNW